MQRDTYRLAELARAAVESKPNQPIDTYKEFLEIHEALMAAEVPTENRVAYYYVWSWWRHPIKRWRQKQALKKWAEL